MKTPGNKVMEGGVMEGGVMEGGVMEGGVMEGGVMEGGVMEGGDGSQSVAGNTPGHLLQRFVHVLSGDPAAAAVSIQQVQPTEAG